MDTDTRSKLYGGEGARGLGLVNRTARGTSDYRTETPTDKDGKATGPARPVKFKRMFDMAPPKTKKGSPNEDELHGVDPPGADPPPGT